MLDAVYVERPGDPSSLDTYDLGEAIARHIEGLDALAETLDVLTLSSFILPTDGEYLEGWEENEEDMEGDTPDTTGLPESFLATDGLMTVQALLDHLQANPQVISDQEAIITQLETLKGVLRFAEENNVGFFLPMEPR
jgi:hypothetical protein